MKRNILTGLGKHKRIIFIFYCLFMLYLLFFQRFAWNRNPSGDYSEWLRTSVNFVPFRTVKDFIEILNNPTSTWNFILLSIANLSGNIILFIPMGIFLPSIFKKQKKLLTFVISIFLIILAVELIQLFSTLGCFDIDDLILNVIGALIGYTAWKVYGLRKHKNEKIVKSA